MIENIIATLICGIIASVTKWVYHFIKSAECNPQPGNRITPKKTLQKQFFISLFIFPLSLSGAWAIPADKLILGFIKIVLGVFAFFSFIFVWGAFDAAFAFYPTNKVGDIPTGDTSNHTGDEKAGVH